MFGPVRALRPAFILAVALMAGGCGLGGQPTPIQRGVTRFDVAPEPPQIPAPTPTPTPTPIVRIQL